MLSPLRKQFKAAGDDVQVIFSGTGTRWVGLLAQPDHNLHGLYADVKDVVAGACGFCAGAFEVADAVKEAGVCILEDYGSNMSYRQLVNDGYQVLMF